MTDKITYGAGGTTFTGPLGVDVFQAAALRSGLGLMAVGIKPHRSWTSLKLALDKATSYTGQKYSGKKDIERARADLQTFVQELKAQLD
jgi:hypothetical protein